MTDTINHEIELYLLETFRVLLDHEIRTSRRYKHPMTLVHIALQVEPDMQQTRRGAEMVVINALDVELRDSDIPCMDGHEFLVLMPSTDEEGARSACDRLEKTLNATDQVYEDVTFQVSAFIGFASTSAEMTLPATKLKQQARAAMECARSNRSQRAISFSELT